MNVLDAEKSLEVAMYHYYYWKSIQFQQVAENDLLSSTSIVHCDRRNSDGDLTNYFTTGSNSSINTSNIRTDDNIDHPSSTIMTMITATDHEDNYESLDKFKRLSHNDHVVRENGKHKSHKPGKSEKYRRICNMIRLYFPSVTNDLPMTEHEMMSSVPDILVRYSGYPQLLQDHVTLQRLYHSKNRYDKHGSEKCHQSPKTFQLPNEQVCQQERQQREEKEEQRQLQSQEQTQSRKQRLQPQVKHQMHHENHSSSSSTNALSAITTLPRLASCPLRNPKTYNNAEEFWYESISLKYHHHPDYNPHPLTTDSYTIVFDKQDASNVGEISVTSATKGLETNNTCSLVESIFTTQTLSMVEANPSDLTSNIPSAIRVNEVNDGVQCAHVSQEGEGDNSGEILSRLSDKSYDILDVSSSSSGEHPCNYSDDDSWVINRNGGRKRKDASYWRSTNRDATEKNRRITRTSTNSLPPVRLHSSITSPQSGTRKRRRKLSRPPTIQSNDHRNNNLIQTSQPQPKYQTVVHMDLGYRCSNTDRPDHKFRFGLPERFPSNFQGRFKLLTRYKDSYGHCRVEIPPWEYSANNDSLARSTCQKLHNWLAVLSFCYHQRHERLLNTTENVNDKILGVYGLSDERIELLRSIGFEFNISSSNSPCHSS